MDDREYDSPSDYEFELDDDDSPYKFVVALLLCVFLGVLGIHRFYVGKIGTGILMLLTGGGCGIWYLIDMILIATGNFRDKHGVRLLP